MTKAGKSNHSTAGRDLAALFASGSVRQQLSALYAWVREIEHISGKANEPAIRAMRFAWHREAVTDLFAQPRNTRRHAAYEGLAGLLDDVAVAQNDLYSIIDAVETGLDPDAVTDQPALLALIDAHFGTVARIAAQICGDCDHPLVAAAGRAIGLERWVSEFPMRAGRQFALIPTSDLNAAAFNIHRLATGREPEKAKQALAPTLDCFAELLAEMRRAGPCPTALFPALGAARLSRATFSKAQRATDLYRNDFSRSQMACQVDLIKASLSGRL